jgi:hypothetical protein
LQDCYFARIDFRYNPGKPFDQQVTKPTMTVKYVPLSKPFDRLTLLNSILLLWERPIPAALFAIAIFMGVSLFKDLPWGVSSNPYFNYLADAFLHGQLNLRMIPPATLDLSLYQGKYFLYWGPMPAIVAMPWVALFGVESSDVLQTIIIGGINAGLIALLLRAIGKRGWFVVTPVQRAMLVLFFTLGTAHAPLPAVGTVWYMASLLSVTFALLAFLAVFSLEHRSAFFWTGVAIAALIATRSSAVFNGIFLAWYLVQRYRSVGLRRLMIYSLFGIAPLVVIGILLLLYNIARFGSPFDLGLNYHLGNPMFAENFQRYGWMNVRFIPINLYLNYIYYPYITLGRQAMLVFNGSLLLLSPLYFAMIPAAWRGRRDPYTLALLVTILLGHVTALTIVTPTYFLNSTNFGPRYFLDFAVPLLLLTALGIQNWHIRWIRFLVALSVIQYLGGAIITTRIF